MVQAKDMWGVWSQVSLVRTERETWVGWTETTFLGGIRQLLLILSCGSPQGGLTPG